MFKMTRRRFMADGAKAAAALGLSLALPEKSRAYSALPTKYIISSDSRYFYHVDKNFRNTQAPIHRSNVIPSAYTRAPLGTVLIDPVKGPEYLWATVEYAPKYAPSAPYSAQVYSFHVVDGVVSNVQGHDVSHLAATAIEVESMCVDNQNRKAILRDTPGILYLCEEDFTLRKSINLGQFGYLSPQGICYVPWLDGYLIADNHIDRLAVINEAEEMIWELHFDRLSPVPTNPQGVAVDYATREILLTYWQPKDGVVRMNWGGIPQEAYENVLWEPTITYANPTSIAVVQEPFRYAAG